MQIVVDKEVEKFDDLKKLTAGSCLGLCGEIIPSQGKKQSIEMQIRKEEGHYIKIFGDCPGSCYPLAKKEHTYEYLREIAYLRPRTTFMGAILRVRNSLIYATHNFFQSKGFIYLHTPIITTSDCEGAGQMFQVTTMLTQANQDPTKLPIEKDKKVIDYKNDFFAKPAFLTVSGQLEGEACACGISDIYTFGPTFRAEISHTPRHLAEFWMMEPEMAFADIDDGMNLAEDFLKYVIGWALKNNLKDLEFFEQKFEKDALIKRLQNVIESDFTRITYTEAISILEKDIADGKVKFENKIYWGVDLASEHERYLTEKVFQRPVILRNYPKEIKSFYMRQNDDGKTVAGYDVLVPKIGEVIGGSQREERLERLDKRIDELHLNKEAYTWYRDLRVYGTNPHTGFGLGFERLIMMVTGVENIRDVIPFPRSTGHAEY